VTAGFSNLVRLLAALLLVAALTAVAVVVWNTQNHQARIGVGWVVAALVVLVVTWRDIRSRPSSPWRTALVVATAWLYFLGFLTALVLVFGWILAWLGLVLGLPATAFAWLARSRLLRGHLDGALLTAGMLVTTGSVALSRPWTPSSSEWAWGAGVAFAAAALVLGNLLMRIAHRPTALVS